MQESFSSTLVILTAISILTTGISIIVTWNLFVTVRVFNRVLEVLMQEEQPVKVVPRQRSQGDVKDPDEINLDLPTGKSDAK